ncbi:MAG: protein-disulfide reductase DsbD N-terminal domain-containing protein [Anaerolineae bacterium]|nr:protein-disulfide reductase DsbD N-terminal domain-containing protein [Anaerolineae bacterium]
MHNKSHVLFLVIIGFFLFSCGTPATSRIELPHTLVSFTENYVDVSVELIEINNGEYFLSARFTPPAGYHLYSKDIPITGVDGLGRPTLLELEDDSTLRGTAELTESVQAIEPDFEPKALLVYPAGAVTLSLPIHLPDGNEWVEEIVKITYMACNENGCKPPVVRKIVSISIPGADRVEQDSK